MGKLPVFPLGGAGGRSAAGSYVGDGKYGIANPTRFTFDFEPKLLLIGTTIAAHASVGFAFILAQELTEEFAVYSLFTYSGADSIAYINRVGNTISLYNNINAYGQMNSAGTNYYWVAIG